MKGSQDRNLRQELKQRSWKKGLTSHDFLSWLSQTTWAGVVPPTVGWSFPHQSSGKTEREVGLHLFLMMPQLSSSEPGPLQSLTLTIVRGIWCRRAESVQPASDLPFEYRKLKGLSLDFSLECSLMCCQHCVLWPPLQGNQRRKHLTLPQSLQWRQAWRGA